ncbi:RNA polymerase alpha subunit [Trinorchestia longiramus]|nr:RNA polymerase alpha subunit [Trinorchestia longiramus]
MRQKVENLKNKGPDGIKEWYNFIQGNNRSNEVPIHELVVDGCKMSNICMESSTMYLPHETGKPHPLGPLSRTMGISQKDCECSTCGQTIEDCPGHFGHVDLNLPVYHWGYFKNVVQILQCICKTCSRVLLKTEDILKFTVQAQKNGNDYLKKKALLKKVIELCKKVKVCSRCKSLNGVVKKQAPMKIIHEKFRGAKKDDSARLSYMHQYDPLTEYAPDMASQLPSNPIEVLYPYEVLKIFNEMNPGDLAVLCMDPQFSHPRDLIITRIPVAPNCVRPSVFSDLKKPGSNEDDISNIMSLIIFLNTLVTHRCNVARLSSLYDAYEILQLHVALLINSEINLPPELNMSRKSYVGFVQRLKGKQGRFRGNLSGKRVDFSSRTVISPDPNLKIDQVGVPEEVAKILTYPERVTAHNIELMRKLIINGPNIHPGAVYLEHKSTPGVKKSIRHLRKKKHELAQNLREGDLIERHLMDGDTVLFNRQPSLHKMSIMAHRAKVLPWRTFRFNECVCGPYNADFDGDEMNLHLPQTEEARAEARTLMAVSNNLVTPRSGALIIGSTQDFITGSYMMTRKSEFFDESSACTLLMSISESAAVQLPPPAIIKPMRLWTGKQLFSLVMRPNPSCQVRVNLIANKCKNQSCPHKDELCPADNFVHVRNSELLSGIADKSIVGAGSRKNILYTLLKDYGKEETAEVMWRIARMSIQYLLLHGFSIGIGDLSPSASLLRMKQNLLDEGNTTCNRYIEQLESGQLETSPGCNGEETLEQVILSVLSKIRDSAGKGCIEELHQHNSALIMAVSGSKGSIINISQMIACVGQQAISGKRVPNGFTNRSLPHYRRYSKIPEARGFVSNSFYSGLTPSEFLFHTMGGREGLVDTAVKTAETGYMQRRLVKCLEDLFVAYDGTVRNSTQEVVQFQYGDDGLDPSLVEVVPKAVDNNPTPPLDFERILYHIKAITPPGNEFLNSSDPVRCTKEYLKELTEGDNKNFALLSENFRKSIIEFMEKESQRMAEAEELESRLQSGHRLRPFTVDQLLAFVQTLVNRYMGSDTLSLKRDGTDRTEAGPGILVEAGTGVGALCAQSIGEPATQMTLKTFHFAGVAAMNITLGVPRIKEIINATRCISTPIITAQLVDNQDAHKARKVKAHIEKTLLGEICEFIKFVCRKEDMYFIIKLASDHINLLQLQVTAATVKYSICTSKMKIHESDVRVESTTLITVRPNQSKGDVYYQMQHIIKHLPKVVVKGLPTINRAVIHQRERKAEEERVEGPVYELLVEGDNLREVMATYGVNGRKCTSNNIVEVFNTLGIEAARQTIVNEITHTMTSHGLGIDSRHVYLLADLMTCRGSVFGITRHGLAKIKESVLMLASFEKTADHLYEASYHGQVNEINGVSESIITGKPINLGTGLFKIMNQHRRSDAVPASHKLSLDIEDVEEDRMPMRRRPLLFDTPEFHVPLYTCNASSYAPVR